MSEVASQTLEIVARELNLTLGDARTALETYAEQPDNLVLIERCANELHQVQGVLRVLEIYGAALLAEEMEQVARYLHATAGERKNHAESLDALMRAMVQLPSYLERVLAGGRDLALVLLPLLNDLRAVRGSALLSEGTLLLLNLKSDMQAQPPRGASDEPSLGAEHWARQLRSRFQAGLIGWIRGDRLDQNLEAIASVAGKLEQVAVQQPVFQLWWVIGAVIEALREGGLEGGVSIKRLLGLADRELRRLYEQGEARYAQSPPVELLNNLLYYVARAESSGPRVTAVRASFRLSELLPVDETIEQERENLSAPSVKLMQTVAGAIREDLAKVKDVLDIFVRRGAGQPAELAPQVELLRKIGDTLGVLGIGELRARVQEETERLSRLVSGELAASDAMLVEIAASLIHVEDQLDDRLVGMILPRSGAGAARPEDADFQQVQAAVLRECIHNLSRVKEAISQNVAGTLDAAALDNWQELMRGIKAALLVLGKTRAVEVVEAITAHVRRIMQPGGNVLLGNALDRLADAIVSVEYYMETLQAGRSDPWYMLDNAEACLRVVEEQPEPAVPTVAQVPAAAFAQTLKLTPESTQVQEFTASAPALDAPAPPPPPPVSTAIAADADPELIHLFIDEAREELAKIQRHFPVWDQNPLERDALVTVRRSFHTLKGSGRMVGARDLSEFAWAIENLLNRLLENAITRTPALCDTLHEAMQVLPELIDQLETGRAPRGQVAAVVARAHALAASREATAARPRAEEDASALTMSVEIRMPLAAEGSVAAAEPSAPPVQAPSPAGDAEADSSESESDEVLRSIYMRETAAHVATVRAYLERQAARIEPHDLPEDVYRACHTLSGSSKAAGARHGIRLAEPLDHWLRKAFDSGLGLLRPDLALLADCMSAVETVAANLDESTGHFVAHEQLLTRLAEAESRLDQRIAAALEAERREASNAPEVEPAPSSTEAIDFDPEVAAIFTEEATELLDAAEAALTAWRTEPASASRRLALKRPLHTLKGGARMAGITPMGDLSHEMETLVVQVDADLVPTNEALFETLQASLDELARMRELVAAGRPAHYPRAIISRIQALSRPGSAAEPQEPIQAESAPVVAELLPATELIELREEPVDPSAESTPEVDLLSGFDTATDLQTLAASLEAQSAESEALADEVDISDSMIVEIGETQEIELSADAFESLEVGGEPEYSGTYVAPPEAGPSEPAPAEREPAQAPETESAAVAEFHGAEFAPELELLPAEPELAAPATPVEPAAAATAKAQPFEVDESRPIEDTQPVEIIEVADGTSASTAEPKPASGDAAQSAASGSDASAPAPPQPVPPGREPVTTTERHEMARVDAELLDQLLNAAGEASIARARLEQQLRSIDFNLGELSRTVTRLKEQQRRLEIETEAQILHRHQDDSVDRSDFDPLELDRYSAIQQYSRALAETAGDVASIQQLLETLTQDAQNLLQQQSRTITELQNGLMRTRMVPFQRHVQRLARIVRQAAADTGKRAELVVEGASGELDRQVLERMLPPFEHMLRNAVVHGIEPPETRRALGKSETGRIHLELRREGAEVMVRVSDDGAGMNLRAIREKGLALGFIQPGQVVSDEAVMQLVLEPGFSTAASITQQAGRGVGMDVVANEVKRLGGALHMETRPGQGTTFTIRLPFTLAISHALIVRTGPEHYALPLPTIEGVLRLPKSEVTRHLGLERPSFEYGGQLYRFQHLAAFVGLEPSPLPEQDVTIPVVLVRAGEHSTGLITDELIGSREIVVKSVGPQISAIRGISGATILGDGRIVVILDIGALVRADWRNRAVAMVPKEKDDKRTVALVVDDSITVRRVTQRLLERNGMRVLTARDGMDAVALLQEHVPDVILLDIEMPRMDGYEVAAQVRNDPRTRDVPIIMITSRVGEKHRARAIELGVDDYLGKPYQEAQLLDAIAPLVERYRAMHHDRVRVVFDKAQNS